MQNNKFKELVFAVCSGQLVFLLVESLKVIQNTKSVADSAARDLEVESKKQRAALGKTNHRIFANHGKKVIRKWGS